MITIIGLGPSGLDRMSIAAFDAVRSAESLMLRTARHPAAEQIAELGVRFDTFDAVYETAGDFDEVYRTIAESVAGAAGSGDVAYAVPGHPLCAERSVEMLLDICRERGLPNRIVGSESFVDACLEALALPLGEGLKIVDGLAMPAVTAATDCANLIHQVYDRATASSVKLTLMEAFPDEHEVAVVRHATGDDQSVEWIPLYMLDRREMDHLTSVYVPALKP